MHALLPILLSMWLMGCGQSGALYFDEAPPADQLPPSYKSSAGTATTSNVPATNTVIIVSPEPAAPGATTNNNTPKPTNKNRAGTAPPTAP